jgi:hypothetical protein
MWVLGFVVDKMVLGQFCVPVVWFSLPISFRQCSILIFHASTVDIRGTRCCVWLRHCATSRKVASSIPKGVIGIFHWHNPSGCTMALGLTQPLNRNEYQEYFMGGKGSQYVELTTLPPSCADCLEKWEPQPPGTLRVCTGIALNFYHLILTTGSIVT